MKKLLMTICISIFFCALAVEGKAGTHHLRIVDQSGNPIPDVTVYYNYTTSNPSPGPPEVKGAQRSDATGQTTVSHPCGTMGSCCMLVSAVSYSISKPGYQFTPATGTVACQTPARDVTVTGTGVELPKMFAGSAANYATTLTNQMIVASFGESLAAAEAGATLPLKTTLGGRKVVVKDAQQMEKAALMLYVSPRQVNFIAPSGLSNGPATLMLQDESNNIVNVGFTSIAIASPGIFTASSDGSGVPAAQVVRVQSGKEPNYEPVAEFNEASGKFVPIPLDLGPETDLLILTLYGTGWRQVRAVANAFVTIGDVFCPIEYIGPQPTFDGLDQLNVRLPRTLIGKGDALVKVTVEGTPANPVLINIK